jgi:hypothetical protein
LLLGQALPVGDHFPNWREIDGVALAEQMAHPTGGVLFDVRVNNFLDGVLASVARRC